MKTNSFSFTENEVQLIIEVLGQRPFYEVYELIGKINKQLIQPEKDCNCSKKSKNHK
ncbi:hypothetical protein [Flammeovirga pacifica]|uniref:hypothetical protein n=1 Tax=Flammeovirga pacifica TaxID=915059 RepID=UPI00157DA353|nr:hypothetical protein [Flammeovirga pacifica]